MTAFGSALRRNEQGKTKLESLSGATVSQTIHNVCAVFRTNLRGSPIVDANGKMVLTIKRQLNGYIAQDPATKHQKCLLIKVFRKLYRSRHTELSTAIGELCVGAFFFGMRSCEYSQVSSARKTKVLQLKHVRFFNNKQKVKKTANMNLYSITSVTITFHRQKNNTKEAKITMHRSHDELCPVLSWGSIDKRILSYPKTNESTPVNYVHLNGKNCYIKSKDVMQLIRFTVGIMGTACLGFGPDDVGTHSIRSSFAMFLYINRVGDSRIMLQGRWKS